VAGTFSQQFCSLARCEAGGRILTGRQLLGVSDITALPQAMRLGRELAREFTAALLTAAAASHAGVSGHPLNSRS
jgi:hypothetical protein